ncbi:MAG TPA: hypothetical protein VKU44_06185 [Terriglobia bacterium]|nr:hypothetical protein [Terriglobia bacterium]
MLDAETGGVVTRQLQHPNGEAHAFYAGLPAPTLAGIEATHCGCGPPRALGGRFEAGLGPKTL